VITYVTVDSTITGVGKYAFDLYRLLKPDSEIIQIIFNKQYMDDNYKSPVTGTRFPAINYPLSSIVYKKAIKKINSIDNIVHITSQTIKPIFMAKHMVVTVHDIMAAYNTNKSKSLIDIVKLFYARKYLKIYLSYENIITISNHVKSEIINNFNINEHNVEVIPPYIPNFFHKINDKNSIRNKLNLPLDKKLILSISSNQPRKNLDMVKNVMQSLGNEYRLVRIGPSVGDSITFNNVDSETINEIYNACDLLYFPTLMEGFGYPVVEAFKTGLPVVSSNIDVIREISSEAAVLVNPNNLDENIKAIKHALDNK
jgi:glycosyltransferase involved in cell wall biosynthesis